MSSTSPPMVSDQEIPTPKRQLVIHANYELFALALALLQVVNSVLWLFLRDQEEGQVIVLISVGISLFLVVDSVYRLARAPSRRRFMVTNSGWLLWLGSLPLPFLALLRLLWYRLMGGRLRRSDYTAMADVVVKKRAQSTLLVAMLAAIIVLEAAAILILGAEFGLAPGQHSGRWRCRVVDHRDHSDRRLWRQVSGDAGRPGDRHLCDGRRRGLVQRADQLPGAVVRALPATRRPGA